VDAVEVELAAQVQHVRLLLVRRNARRPFLDALQRVGPKLVGVAESKEVVAAQQRAEAAAELAAEAEQVAVGIRAAAAQAQPDVKEAAQAERDVLGLRPVDAVSDDGDGRKDLLEGAARGARDDVCEEGEEGVEEGDGEALTDGVEDLLADAVGLRDDDGSNDLKQTGDDRLRLVVGLWDHRRKRHEQPRVRLNLSLRLSSAVACGQEAAPALLRHLKRAEDTWGERLYEVEICSQERAVNMRLLGVGRLVRQHGEEFQVGNEGGGVVGAAQNKLNNRVDGF
jgi:hypothetical protein